ncbi:hypothetical protein SO802_018101 [Lithocarpus litseifolius]|uniref:RNase H type-1 domain-containing protein n=1 Tax=Lithocarpus litseifolius TaxID=425828 RepID=A0AAW2CKA9_9ROSI
MDFVKEYRDAQCLLEVGSASTDFLLQNWKPPTGQLYKLNFDAAIFANGSGVGAVICFAELIVEGDNSMVMSSVSSSSPNWSRLRVIYDDIRCLAAGLHYVSFTCIRRSVNSVAHSLTRYANVLDEEVVWLEDSPPPARDALYFHSSFLNE